jgi:hypothetical protein
MKLTVISILGLLALGAGLVLAQAASWPPPDAGACVLVKGQARVCYEKVSAKMCDQLAAYFAAKGWTKESHQQDKDCAEACPSCPTRRSKESAKR